MRFVAVYLAYVLSAEIGLGFAMDESIASPIWPPSGVGLCALLLLGARYWPAILLAGMTTTTMWTLQLPDASVATSLLTGACIGSANAIEAWLGHRILTIVNGKLPPIQRGHRVAWLIPVALVVSAVSAVIGSLTVTMTATSELAPFGNLFLTWWIGDLAGILTITPLIYGWPGQWRRRLLTRKSLEAFCSYTFIAVGGTFLFTLTPEHHIFQSLPLLMSPLLMWSAFRYTPPVTALFSATIAVLALMGTLQGLGPLQRDAHMETFIALQIFLCINAIISICVTASFAYQKRIAFSLAQINETLEHRIGERTADLEKANTTLSQKVLEKERAETSLLRSEQRYRDIAEAAADWLWELDANLCFVNASTGLAEMVGSTPDDLYGKSFVDIAHPDVEWNGWTEHMRNLLASGLAFRNKEFTICAADSSACHLQVSGKPLLDPDGSVSGYRGMAVDVTALESSRRLASSLGHILNESLNEIYLLHTRSLQCMMANRGAHENLQYSRDEITELEPAHFLPDYSEETLRDLLQPLIDGVQERLVLETRHLRADKTQYPVELNLQYVKYANTSAILAIAVDMSEQKALQNQLVRAQKLEAIGQLAAGVAHEINTPTQYVSDNVRFLKESFEEVFPILESVSDLTQCEEPPSAVTLKQVREALDKADLEFLSEEIPSALSQSLDGLSRIADIVRAMKDFSHPGGGEKDAMNVNEIVSNAITVSANEWKYVADMETELADDLPLVPCLRGELGQVILNMIVNAAHAIVERLGDGGSEKGVIRIVTRACRTCVKISISDTGAGIPAELHDKIFDMFFTTKAVGKGTGQGLSLAHTVIVEKHAGTIDVESTVGEGSTFYITLPRCPKTSVIAEEAA